MNRLMMISLGGLLFAAGTAVPQTSSAAPSAKVDVCHLPPGNPSNFHTITISEKAKAAHVAHGDEAGACDDYCATLCDDEDACTIDDDSYDCESAGCPTTSTPVDCDDGNAYTADSCDSSSGCESVCAISAKTCDGTLTGIGTGDLSVHFELTTTATVTSALASQRSRCGSAYYEDWWQIRMGGAGNLYVELGDDQGTYEGLSSGTSIPVNDGNPHTIDVIREDGVLSIIIDCQLTASRFSTANFNNTTFPALRSTTDVCIGTDPTKALVGTLSGLCVSKTL